MEVLVMLGQTHREGGAITSCCAGTVLSQFLGLHPRVVRKRAVTTLSGLVPVFARCFESPDGAGRERVFKIHDADELIAFYDDGHGPLAQLPLWVQAALFLPCCRILCLY